MRARPIVLVTVASALVAVGAGVALWRQTRPVVRTQTTVVQSPQPPTVVADCPTTRCQTVAARPEVLTAVRTVYPSAVLLGGTRTVGADKKVYSEATRLTAGLESISVSARCVADIGPVAGQTMSSSPGSSPVLVSVVVGGRNGCSVAVTVSVPRAPVDTGLVGPPGSPTRAADPGVSSRRGGASGDDLVELLVAEPIEGEPEKPRPNRRPGSPGGGPATTVRLALPWWPRPLRSWWPGCSCWPERSVRSGWSSGS